MALAVPRRSASRSRRGVSPAPVHAHDPLASTTLDHSVSPLELPSSTIYSASAQLRFLADSSAANAELFWQLQSEARRSSFSSTSSSASSPASSAARATASTAPPSAAAPTAPPGTALVYIHAVRPTDTLPSILLTYKTDAATVKKTNRLWANDAIQTRASLMLPTDKCAIPLQCHLRAEKGQLSNFKGVPAGSSLVGWAIVDGVGQHVEVCAVPCARLGYFPSRSAVSVATSASASSSPRISVDSIAATDCTTDSDSSSISTADLNYKVSSPSIESESLPSSQQPSEKQPSQPQQSLSPSWFSKVVWGLAGTSTGSSVVSIDNNNKSRRAVSSESGGASTPRAGRDRASPRIVPAQEDFEMLPEEELYR
ncbi:hypothetical protein BZA70DRAFT_273777 [Myxozyma melibiosi]|uniref:LysM domain-containing protein n=1 Tax=Myxozyma melibiosi TaxID=54550 RepID=A0ABR1FFX7_9ASCO